MKLAPRIIQAMEILQLPMMALQERIEQELQSNPVLEMRDAEVDPEAPIAREEPPDDRGEHQMVVDEDNGNTSGGWRILRRSSVRSSSGRTRPPGRPRPPASATARWTRGPTRPREASR